MSAHNTDRYYRRLSYIIKHTSSHWICRCSTRRNIIRKYHENATMAKHHIISAPQFFWLIIQNELFVNNKGSALWYYLRFPNERLSVHIIPWQFSICPSMKPSSKSFHGHLKNLLFWSNSHYVYSVLNVALLLSSILWCTFFISYMFYFFHQSYLFFPALDLPTLSILISQIQYLNC